jgi:hypothetical protein
MVDRAMAEKYLHSRGAALYEEGKFGEAIELFKEAITLDEHAYTQCHLGLSFLAKHDLDRALGALGRAIELSPSTARYYYERSAVWRLRGDVGRADEDYRAALRIDPHYGRIEKIRAGTVILQGAGGPAGWFREGHEHASCIVPCPSYCCHFRGEPVVHGVCIGPWKLRALRRFFREKGLREEAFLGRLPFRQVEEHTRLIPPNFVVKEEGQDVVFYPKRARSRLGRGLLKHLPRAGDYGELAWITEEARACVFLDRGRCAIHDLGDEPALPACKEFFCLTGLVFFFLARFGLVSRAEIEARTMAELNRIAVEVVLVLSDGPDLETALVLGRERISAIIGSGRGGALTGAGPCREGT